MKETKRNIKENNIIVAAEKVFGAVGFKNAKIDDIAKEAKITKVTLYTYFQSKENLYLAITYRGLQKLNEAYYKTLDKFKTNNGLESVVELTDTFMTFCEDNFLYSEALLDYFSMMRTSASGADISKLTEATKESIYYLKLQDIHNLPFKLTVKEIIRGQEDGSILQSIDPMTTTIHGWTAVIGYSKILSANGSNQSPLFNVKLSDLRELNLKIVNALLSSQVVKNQLEEYEVK